MEINTTIYINQYNVQIRHYRQLISNVVTEKLITMY